MRTILTAAVIAAAAGHANAQQLHYYAGNARIDLAEPAIRADGAVLTARRGIDPLAAPDRALSLTRQLVIQTKPGDDPADLAAQWNARLVRSVTYAGKTFHILEVDSPIRAVQLAATAVETRLVDVAEPIIERTMARRAYTPTDPLVSSQWHLEGGAAGMDTQPVWDLDITGTGVGVAIVDDGLEHAHPDFPNYSAALSWDFNGGDPDPTPSGFDFHGTPCAGVAAASGTDGACGVGAAPGATVSGIRLISAGFGDATAASALTYKNGDDGAATRNDISSNSWGPWDDGHYEGPGALVAAALEDAATNGRDGLGVIYTWAAGNGLTSNDNVNYDGYANSRFTIAVTAITNSGVQSYYAEPGACTLVAAPSNGGLGITTSDQLGSAGLSSGQCTGSFGGTSSACPAGAGVCALILDANPNLTWRDVQHILANTARQNDPGDSDWTTNGAGHLINHKYGFGVIDAPGAVNAALTWTNVAPALSDSGAANVNQAIPNNNATGVSSSITLTDTGIDFLEHVEVSVDIPHTAVGDLEIELVSPSGTSSLLAEQHSDNANNLVWTFMTVRNWDEPADGQWTLTVRDRASGSNTGTFDSWSITVHGTAAPPPPAPGAFALSSPAPGATDIETGPVLQWTAAADADDYLVEIDDNADFLSPEISQSVSAAARATSLDLPDATLNEDTTYNWRVTASNAGGNTGSTPAASTFTTLAPTPLCLGDLDADNDTDVFDFNIFAPAFGTSLGDPGFVPAADFDNSNTIDVFDFNLFAPDFGCDEN